MKEKSAFDERTEAIKQTRRALRVRERSLLTLLRKGILKKINLTLAQFARYEGTRFRMKRPRVFLSRRN